MTLRQQGKEERLFSDIKELLLLPCPVWVVLIFIAFIVLQLEMEHSERQEQTHSLDQRVFKLELSR